MRHFSTLLASVATAVLCGEALGESNEPFSYEPFRHNWAVPNWGALDRDGYIHIHRYVTGDVKEWSRRLTANWEKNVVNFPGPGNRARDGPEMVRMRESFGILMRNITRSHDTGLRADFIKDPVHCDNGATTSYYFSSGTPSNKRAADELNSAAGSLLAFNKGLEWHTDVSFIWDEDHNAANQWLNFYIPVLKPRADDANLEILPFSKVPEIRTLLEGSSSKGYVAVPKSTPMGGTTIESDGKYHGKLNHTSTKMKVLETDMMGCSRHRSFNPSILDRAVVPQLAEGDMLIVRGDVIHRTGKREHLPFRLAMSVRVLQTPTEATRAANCLQRRAAKTASVFAASQFNPTLCNPTKRRTRTRT